LNDDLTHRAHAHLNEMKKEFILKGSLGVVEKEALYLWARSQMMGYPLSYDQLQRVCAQIAVHPHQQQWTLQVGGGWNIVRNGAALSVTGGGTEDKGTEKLERELEWSYVDDTVESQEMVDALLVRVDNTNCIFVLSDARRTGKCLFTPPWRENPLELRDFLRGQKVPLHLRGCTPVIRLHQGEVVAVFVERSEGEHHFGGKIGRWIVDAQFDVEKERAGQLICLQLLD
jgi:hypothetical protein